MVEVPDIVEQLKSIIGDEYRIMHVSDEIVRVWVQENGKFYKDDFQIPQDNYYTSAEEEARIITGLIQDHHKTLKEKLYG